MRAEPAVDFWLRWAESEGALHETVGDVALAVLPGELRDSLGLPEEVAITADPEVAREDGALLLAAGHPVLDHATEAVLRRGDADIRALAAPAGAAPDERSLLAKAREAFPVDHGRIDLAEPPVPCQLPVLRVGALITYAVALDERFQEQAEAWVDVPAAAAVPNGIADRLGRAAQEPVRVDPEPVALTAAVEAGHRLLETGALARRHVLSGQLQRSREDELARTRSYYQAMLTALARRRLAATPERRGALDAKAEAAQAERDRRLAEVEEKFRPHHDIRPFRLHLLWVPALRLAVHVKRGPRAYPMVLHWLRPAAAFTPLPCRSCGGSEPWVAGKQRLGCRSCLPNAAVIPARTAAGPGRAELAGSGHEPARAARGASLAQAAPGASPAKTERPLTSVPQPKPAASAPGSQDGATAIRAKPRGAPRPAGERPVAGLTGDRVDRLVDAASRKRLAAAGDRLGLGMWQAALDGNRRLRRLLAPDSPAAALHRLYGAGATMWVLGIPPGETPVAATATTVVHNGCSGSTSGVVETRRSALPYTLRWELAGGRPALTEVLAVPTVFELRLPWLNYPGSIPTWLRQPPTPQEPLDPVAQALWRALLPRGGLLLVARCLAAYWRVGQDAPLSFHSPPVLAAALAHQVGRRAGLAITYPQVATEFHVDEARLRAAAAQVSRQLGLSATRVW